MGGAMKYFLKKLLVQETFKKFMKNFEKFVKPSGPPSYILNVHSLRKCETALTSISVAKFACFNLVSNIEPPNLLISRIKIYWTWLGILFLISPILYQEK